MIVKDILVKPGTIEDTQLATKARSIFQKKKKKYLIATKKKAPTGVISLKSIIRLKDKKSNLQCKSFSDPISVVLADDLPIIEAAKLMETSSSDVGIILYKGKLKGTIDHEALLSGFLKAGYSPVKKTIAELNPANLSAKLEATPAGVLRKLQKSPGVAVLKKKEVIGVISRSDFLSHSEFRNGGKHLDEVTTSPAFTVNSSTKVEAAAGQMIKRNFSILPVVDGKNFIGTVTSADLVSAYVG
ncbi:CBS domain-containing protein [Candidatus Undinarchaeota archaeon]